MLEGSPQQRKRFLLSPRPDGQLRPRTTSLKATVGSENRSHLRRSQPRRKWAQHCSGDKGISGLTLETRRQETTSPSPPTATTTPASTLWGRGDSEQKAFRHRVRSVLSAGRYTTPQTGTSLAVCDEARTRSFSAAPLVDPRTPIEGERSVETRDRPSTSPRGRSTTRMCRSSVSNNDRTCFERLRGALVISKCFLLARQLSSGNVRQISRFRKVHLSPNHVVRAELLASKLGKTHFHNPFSGEIG